MNVANNEDFKKNLKKLCVISQFFLLQVKMYNLVTKSYYCVMENTTVNAVNAAKTTLWQSNVSNLLNSVFKNHWRIQGGARPLCAPPLGPISFIS